MFYIWGLLLATIGTVVLLGVVVYLSVVKDEIDIEVRFWPPSFKIRGRGPRPP